jgi:hypothetical protein
MVEMNAHFVPVAVPRNVPKDAAAARADCASSRKISQQCGKSSVGPSSQHRESHALHLARRVLTGR